MSYLKLSELKDNNKYKLKLYSLIIERMKNLRVSDIQMQHLNIFYESIRSYELKLAFIFSYSNDDQFEKLPLMEWEKEKQK